MCSGPGVGLKESGLEGAGVGVDTVQTFCMRASTVQSIFLGIRSLSLSAMPMHLLAVSDRGFCCNLTLEWFCHTQ